MNLEKFLDEEKKLAVQKASFESNISQFKQQVTSLTKEIGIMLKNKSKVDEINKLYSWLQGYFILLMSSMEKQIMVRVHSDFSSLFDNWFNMLVETDDIGVMLDEEFTPTILQNGYDIDYRHLSGGEKTAIALAYRLSLNQVVNNIMMVIKTRDLLILDEPT